MSNIDTPASNNPTPAPPAAPVTITGAKVETKYARSYRWLSIFFVAQLPIMLMAGYLSSTKFTIASMWALIILGMLAFMGALGYDLQGRIGGILISERNLMSLSRFQIVAWTLLLASAYIMIALARVFAGVDDPLAVALPADAWQLMGISATSTVGASLILQNKKKKTAAEGEAEKTGKAVDETTEEVQKNAQGLAYANKSSNDAHFSDMFEGDELANTAYIDISKVQMFFFTLVALVAYGAELGTLMSSDEAYNLAAFPDMSDGLIAILGISHAAYLGKKSVDHTKTQ